jgi:undecaprenyl diphosphate synthase
MDGNGRWAQQHGRPRTEGHRRGSDAVRRTVRAARRLGVDALTLYAFSEQNWDRPRDEVDALMELLTEFLISERDEILDHRIRLRSIGRTDRLPEHVQRVLHPLLDASAPHAGMTLTLALSYGGREEMADAARALAERVAAGELEPAAITEATLEAALPSMHVGPVDLLIRTGGEQRISNFLLWGAAYAELVFLPRFWPEFQEADLYEAIAAFQRRDRRFGRVAEDDRPSAAPGPAVSRVHL